MKYNLEKEVRALPSTIVAIPLTVKYVSLDQLSKGEDHLLYRAKWNKNDMLIPLTPFEGPKSVLEMIQECIIVLSANSKEPLSYKEIFPYVIYHRGTNTIGIAVFPNLPIIDIFND